MKALLQLFILLFAAVTASATTTPNATTLLDSLPPCSIDCIVEGVTKDGCTLTDLACGCSKINELTKIVSPCLAKAGCTLEQMTRRFAQTCPPLDWWSQQLSIANIWLSSTNRNRIKRCPILRIRRPPCQRHVERCGPDHNHSGSSGSHNHVGRRQNLGRYRFGLCCRWRSLGHCSLVSGRLNRCEIWTG